MEVDKKGLNLNKLVDGFNFPTYINISCCENHLRLLAKRVERVLEERPDLLQLLLPNISRVLGCLSLKEKKLACRECLPALMIVIISLVVIIQVGEQ